MQPNDRHSSSRPSDVLRLHLHSAFQFPQVVSSTPSPPPSGSTPSRPDAKAATRPKVAGDVVPTTNKTNAPEELPRLVALLRERLGEKCYKHGFEGKTSFRIAEDELIVGVSSPFLVSWMQKQFRDPLAEVSRTILGPSARVRWEVDGELSAALHHEPARPAAKLQQPGSHLSNPNSKEPASSARPEDAAFRPGRSFAKLEEFIEGESCTLAMTAIREICQAPGQLYNPLYLHGGVGLGKTHLLEGIYRAIRARYPALRVLFMTSEAFTNYFTAALREKTLPSFRQRFRNVDVLLIDDLDFLDSKRGIQEEFLHTFKQLESRGGQIVLTADRHPRLLTHLSDELMTRCLSGMVCRLESPDQPTRQRIAAAHAARQRAELTPEVLEFVARRFSRNVRELQGAVNTLATYARMTSRRVSLSAARRVLADLERDCTRIVRMAEVEQTVCQFFGITPDDLKSGKRLRSLTQPRMLAMFLIRKHTQAAYQEIGQFFGGRNHSTVISAEKKVLGWLADRTQVKLAANSWPIDEVLDLLERQLQAG